MDQNLKVNVEDLNENFSPYSKALGLFGFDEKSYIYIMSPKNLTSLVIMISVYSKNDELDEVVKHFDKTKNERNSKTWNLNVKFM